MTANVITLARIGLLPFILIFLFYGHDVSAFTLFLAAALTDWLDGYFARKWNQVSDFGKFLDPLVDKILVISILIALVEMGRVIALPVIIIAVRELAISGWRLVKAKGGEVVPASMTAKYKTTLQLFAVGMLLLNLPYANAMLWLSVLATIISGIEYAKS